MRPALVVVTILAAAAVIAWTRSGESFPLPQALPLCGGRSPSLSYDLLGGLGLGLVALWGLSRVARLGRPEPEPEEEPETEETLEPDEPEPDDEEPQQDEPTEDDRREPQQEEDDDRAR